MTEAAAREMHGYAPGTFCWIELGASNAETAKQFYTELFAWDFSDNPTDPGMVHSTLKQSGKDVGALYQLPPEMTAQGNPSYWMPYISVATADETAVKAKEAGGTLIKDPYDVSTVGRMAIVRDPTGAVFALWEAATHHGAGIVNVPHSFCWAELGTTDAAKATDFYTKVFGWSANVQHLGTPCYSMDYTMLFNGERLVGGLYTVPLDMRQGPPHWMIYFAVEDCDAMAEKANSLGAKTISRTMNIPGRGAFSVLRDPQGAAFAIHQAA